MVANAVPFTESLADRVGQRLSANVPLLALPVVQQPHHAAGSVTVFGVDDRFFRLHHVEPSPSALRRGSARTSPASSAPKPETP